MALKEDTGMGTQIELPYVNSLVIAVFLGIAIYNVLELTILIQTFFKRRSGLYYYSLLVSNFGIFFHALTNLLKFYELNYSVPGHTIANTVIAWISWVAMITGQSVVLWSRLHLVARSSMTRWVLVLIIVDAVVLHTSTGVLTFLTNLSKDPSRWKRPYAIVERIQVVLFFLQEVLISSIYIWKTAVMLRAEGPLLDANRNVRGKKGKRVLGHTIAMSVIIIALDITLIAVQFSGFYDIQTSYKDAVYSVKLKMEFTILNQLIELVKGNVRGSALPDSPSASPYTRNTDRIAGSRICSTITEIVHTPNSYTRMDDKQPPSPDVLLTRLKPTAVLKTTTTEIRRE